MSILNRIIRSCKYNKKTKCQSFLLIIFASLFTVCALLFLEFAFISSTKESIYLFEPARLNDNKYQHSISPALDTTCNIFQFQEDAKLSVEYISILTNNFSIMTNNVLQYANNIYNLCCNNISYSPEQSRILVNQMNNITTTFANTVVNKKTIIPSEGMYFPTCAEHLSKITKNMTNKSEIFNPISKPEYLKINDILRILDNILFKSMDVIKNFILKSIKQISCNDFKRKINNASDYVNKSFTYVRTTLLPNLCEIIANRSTEINSELKFNQTNFNLTNCLNSIDNAR